MEMGFMKGQISSYFPPHAISLEEDPTPQIFECWYCVKTFCRCPTEPFKLPNIYDWWSSQILFSFFYFSYDFGWIPPLAQYQSNQKTSPKLSLWSWYSTQNFSSFDLDTSSQY